MTLLRFVRRAKKLGFNLEEIRRTIGASRSKPREQNWLHSEPPLPLLI